MNHRISIYNALLILSCLLVSPTTFSNGLEPYHDNGNSDFSLPDLKGVTHTLSDYKGKVVLVNFWASWCPPCIYEMPELTKLKKHFADQPFEILALNVGEKKYRVRKFVKLINLKLPVLLDLSKETFNNWGVKTLPTSYLIDGDGHVRYHVRGNPGWEQEETITAIEKLITETTITTKPGT